MPRRVSYSAVEIVVELKGDGLFGFDDLVGSVAYAGGMVLLLMHAS